MTAEYDAVAGVVPSVRLCNEVVKQAFIERCLNSRKPVLKRQKDRLNSYYKMVRQVLRMLIEELFELGYLVSEVLPIRENDNNFRQQSRGRLSLYLSFGFDLSQSFARSFSDPMFSVRDRSP